MRLRALHPFVLLLIPAVVNAIDLPAIPQPDTVRAFEDGPSSMLATPPQITIEAGEADGQAEVALQIRRHWGVKLSTPLSENDDPTQPADLDGLSQDTALAIDYSRLFRPRDNIPAAVDALSAMLIAACPPAKAKIDETGNLDGLINLADQMKSGEIDCGSDRLADPGQLQRTYYDIAFPRWSWGFRLQGRVGYHQYEFFELDGSKEDEDTYGKSVGVALAGVHKGRRLAIGLDYENAVKPSEDEAEKCTPVTGSTTLDSCESLPLGAPQHKSALVARVEYRIFFDYRKIPMAISPMVSLSDDDKVVGIEVPLHFLATKDGALTGGLRVGWKSDESGIDVAVFLSRPLRLFF